LVIWAFTYIPHFPILDIARFSGHVSVSGSQITAFKTTFIVLAVMGAVWLTAIGAVLYAVNVIQDGGASKTIADGSIFMTVLALALIINVAIIAPGLLMLQPFRLWRVTRNERRAITPRQRFRGTFFTVISLFCIGFTYFPPTFYSRFPDSPAGRCCIEVDPYSDQPFIPLFDSRLPWRIRPSVRDVVLHPCHYFRLSICSDPSVGRTGGDPPVASDAHWYASAYQILDFHFRGCIMTFHVDQTAHRFLVGYVYGRTKSPTGGLVQLFMLRRFALLLALQPLVLGLILLSRRLWPEAGALLGASLLVALLVEVFCTLKTREPGVKSLSPVTRNALETFKAAARPVRRRHVDEESVSLVDSEKKTRSRGSMASVLEMMSITLAVIPSSTRARGPVPLRECIVPAPP